MDNSKKITYILSILSAPEANKSSSKQKLKIQSIYLSIGEPWDWMKAQILVKISAALDPCLLEFNHYEIMFFIPSNFPKPGLTLLNEEDYAVILSLTGYLAHPPLQHLCQIAIKTNHFRTLYSNLPTWGVCRILVSDSMSVYVPAKQSKKKILIKNGKLKMIFLNIQIKKSNLTQ